MDHMLNCVKKKGRKEKNAHRSGVPRDAPPFFAGLGWKVLLERGYIGIAEPYLKTPGMQANLAMASQLDVNEEDLDAYFRFFVLLKTS